MGLYVLKSKTEEEGGRRGRGGGGGGEAVSVKWLDLLRALVKASEPNQNEQEEAERVLKSVFSP